MDAASHVRTYSWADRTMDPALATCRRRLPSDAAAKAVASSVRSTGVVAFLFIYMYLLPMVVERSLLRP